MLLFTAVPFTHLVIRSLAVYHPSKVQPVLVGLVEGVNAAPATTVAAATALPPLELKVIV